MPCLLKLGLFSQVCIIKIKCDALYHLNKLKNIEKTHAGVLLLVRLRTLLEVQDLTNRVQGLRNCHHRDDLARNAHTWTQKGFYVHEIMCT